MDIKHVLSLNPLQPAYAGTAEPGRRARPARLGRRRGRAGRDRSPRRRLLASTTSCRAHQRGLEPFRLADRLVTNGEWLEFMADGGYRRPSSGSPTAGRKVKAEGWRGAVLLDRGRRRLVRAHPARHLAGQPGAAGLPRQPLRGRRLRHLGRQAAARPRPSGSTRVRRRPDARGRRQPRRHRDLPPAGGRPVDGRPAPGATATAGSGPRRPTCPTRASTPPPARSASTTASSCPTRWCCAAAAPSPRPATPAPSYRNFFPPGARWALSGVRLADGGAPRSARMSRRARAGRVGPAGPRLGQRQPGRRRTPRAGPAPADAAARSGSTTTWAPSSSTRSPGCRSTTRSRPSARSWRRTPPRSPRRAGPPPWSSSGAGTSEKTRLLLDAFTATGQLDPVRPGRRLRGDAARGGRRDRPALPGPGGRGGGRRLHPAPGAPAARRPPDGGVPRRHHRQPLPRGAARLPRRPRRRRSSPATRCCSAPTWSRAPTG